MKKRKRQRKKSKEPDVRKAARFLFAATEGWNESPSWPLVKTKEERRREKKLISLHPTKTICEQKRSEEGRRTYQL